MLTTFTDHVMAAGSWGSTLHIGRSGTQRTLVLSTIGNPTEIQLAMILAHMLTFFSGRGFAYT